MDKTREKEITKLKLAGLLFGTGLAASIHFGIKLIPFEGEFFSYTSILYFFSGIFFGFFIPGLSWKGGFWLTLPWIVRTFFVIAGTGFKDGIPASIGWLNVVFSSHFASERWGLCWRSDGQIDLID